MSALRCFVIVGLLPAVASAQFDSAKKVSFSAPAARAEKLLPTLGTALGVTLRATPTTASDVLLISVKDVSTSALMQKIAETENASWQPEGDGFRLNRDAGQRQQDQNQETATLAARYRDGLTKLAKEVAALKAFDETYAHGLVQRAENANTQVQNGSNWQLMEQVNAESPGTRLLTRLICTLKAEDLATIPEDGRLVFSDNPNKMQRRFPSTPTAAIQQFLKDQNIMSRAASGAAGDQNPYSNLNSILHPNVSQPAKVILVATRQPFQGSISCELQVLDANDNMLEQANKSIGSSPFEDMNGLMQSKPKEGETKIVLSAEAKELRGRLSIMDGRGKVGPDLGPELKRKVCDPANFDPLSIVSGLVLTQYASGLGDNLVASLTDMSMLFSMPFSGDEILSSQIPQMLRMAEQSSEAKDGWLIIRPNLPVEARRTQCDRAALGVLMRALAAKGTLRVDDAATYALTSSSVQFDPLAMLYSATLSQTAMQVFQQNGMPMLRFYGSLTPAQRQAAQANRPIPFTSLVPAQKNALLEMTFGSQSRLNEVRAMTMEEGSTPTFPTSEPTEKLPNGITNDGRFTLELKSESVVIPAREVGSSVIMDGGMTANDLAWRVFAQEHPEVGGPWAQEPQNHISLDSLTLNSRTTYGFHFQLSPTTNLDEEIREMEGDGKKVAFSDLPTDFRSEYAKLMDQYKTMKWGTNQGIATPPPPP